MESQPNSTRARRTPAAASVWAVLPASSGVTLKLMPSASRMTVPGTVSMYARHGCSQNERRPKGTTSSCRCAMGDTRVAQGEVTSLGPGVAVGAGVVGAGAAVSADMTVGGDGGATGELGVRIAAGVGAGCAVVADADAAGSIASALAATGRPCRSATSLEAEA